MTVIKCKLYWKLEGGGGVRGFEPCLVFFFSVAKRRDSTFGYV